jgi:glycosyltransferase involved in cell wall biosynthesis
MNAPGEKISVIIPVFNRRQEVLRAIASVEAQTLSPSEIIVVDDASTDDTAEAVASLGDERVRLLRHEHNRGASAARNTGVAAARGDWIAFLDSDDVWETEKLARQLSTLAAAPDDVPAGVTGYVIDDYRTGRISTFHPEPAMARLDSLVWGCPLGIGSTLLARRAVFDRVGLLDAELPRLEDWEWLMRYLPVYRLGVLPAPLTIVHKTSDPSHARVAAAIARIRALHRRAWYRRSWLSGRKFDSTLLIEEAAAATYARNWPLAALLTLRALTAYPLRPGLAAMLARRLGRRRASEIKRP